MPNLEAAIAMEISIYVVRWLRIKSVAYFDNYT